MALRWREEGAQIVGGCCGVGPEHVAAAREALSGTAAGHARRRGIAAEDDGGDAPAGTRPGPWTDARGSSLYPLDFPDILCEPGVFVPTQGSYLVWKYLFREGIGSGARCLDVGCGTGLQTVQLARNGAAHVHAIDVDRRRRPEHAHERVPKRRRRPGHRGAGRPLPVGAGGALRRDRRQPLPDAGRPVRPRVDPPAARLLGPQPDRSPDRDAAGSARAENGVAYLMQLSIIGQRRTAALLDRAGFASRVVDFGFFEFNELFQDKEQQIHRVEQLSDAYHIRLGDQNVIVAYLIEVTRDAESEAPPA